MRKQFSFIQTNFNYNQLKSQFFLDLVLMCLAVLVGSAAMTMRKQVPLALRGAA